MDESLWLRQGLEDLQLLRRKALSPSTPRRALIQESTQHSWALNRGSIVVPFWVSYIESYQVILKRNYHGAYG